MPLDKLSKRLDRASYPNSIFGRAEVQEQTARGRQEERRLDHIQLPRETCFFRQLPPISERIFEHAGELPRISESQPVQLEDESRRWPGFRCTQPLPVPAHKSRQGARFLTGLEPSLDAPVLALA